MAGQGFGGEEVREESSWRYPLGIFLATLILCAIFLYYYVGPSVDELSGSKPSPAISEEPVTFTVNGVGFSVPTNYTVYPKDRRGGERDEVALYALWPVFAGYTPSRRDEFIENDEGTRRIDILISPRVAAFTEEERVNELYLPHANDRRGIPTTFQLMKYTFSEQHEEISVNGYADTELFLGEADDDGMIALFCFEDRDDIRSPECWRQFELTPGVTVTYRFKRHLLEEWRAIDTRVRAFLEERMENGDA